MDYTVFKTPIGYFKAVQEDGYITQVSYRGERADEVRAQTEVLKELCRQFDRYFDGSLKEFSLPIKITGTPFRKRVLEELLKTGYGQTTTYKSLARAVGNPNASRAVGSAMRTNPLVIIVPCHRVLPSGGKLGNYSAGGPANKEWLLAFEKQNSDSSGFLGILSALQ